MSFFAREQIAVALLDPMQNLLKIIQIVKWREKGGH
jgi:hypothetical protein